MRKGGCSRKWLLASHEQSIDSEVKRTLSMHRVFHRRCTFRNRALFANISVTISIIRCGTPDGNRFFPFPVFPSIRSFLRVCLLPIPLACSRLRRSLDLLCYV